MVIQPAHIMIREFIKVVHQNLWPKSVELSRLSDGFVVQ